MRKSTRKSSTNNSSTIEVLPELFNFFANKGKNVSLILKNEKVKIGTLLCVCPDEVIILEIKTPNGITYISETPLFDVSEILVIEN